MLVAKYYNNNDIRLEELPRPKIGPGEILVKVRASGICGTDVMEWYRLPKAPRILGHEIAGTIGLDRRRAEQALTERTFKEAVDRDWEYSRTCGVTAVPKLRPLRNRGQ